MDTAVKGDLTKSLQLLYSLLYFGSMQQAVSLSKFGGFVKLQCAVVFLLEMTVWTCFQSAIHIMYIWRCCRAERSELKAVFRLLQYANDYGWHSAVTDWT